MKRYHILDEASAELDSAATWYEEQREGLGLELVRCWRSSTPVVGLDIGEIA